jgi:type IV pilus assembly protein PilX
MKALHLHTPQHGATLITVLVIMLLTMTAVLAGYRASSLNEIITSNTSDYQRALAAAEALIRDAEIDVRGRKPDNSNCIPAGADPLNFIGCRETTGQTNSNPFFPQSSEDYDTIQDIVEKHDAVNRCQNGICVPPNLELHANLENTPAMWNLGATYGQYSQADLGAQSNPILADANKARYWIEVFKYTSSIASGSTTTSHLTPDAAAPFVYRITAVARGLKDGTQVVIKTTFVPYPASQGE